MVAKKQQVKTVGQSAIENVAESSDVAGSAAAQHDASAATRAPRKKNTADEVIFKASYVMVLSQGEQERRDAARAFRKHIFRLHAVLLRVSEEILLLQLAGWDTGAAIEAFIGHPEARNRLREAFDSLREPPTNVDNECHVSKCLQILIEITRRADWWSLKNEILENDGNLIKTIIDWCQRGVLVFKKKPDEKRQVTGWGVRKNRYGHPLEKPSDESVQPAGDSAQWAEEPPSFEFIDPNNPDVPQPVPFVYGQEWRDTKEQRAAKLKKAPNGKQYDREPGFLINAPRENRQRGLISQRDFHMEWFHAGKFWSRSFHHEKYKWEEPVPQADDDDCTGDNDGTATLEPPDNANAVEFDQNNQAHVDLLNHWRN